MHRAAAYSPLEANTADRDPAECIFDMVEAPADERVLDPEWHGRTIVASSPREAAAAQLERYAAQLRCGELDGVRMQWREGLNHLECVELEAHPVVVEGRRVLRIQLLRYELDTLERPLGKVGKGGTESEDGVRDP